MFVWINYLESYQIYLLVMRRALNRLITDNGTECVGEAASSLLPLSILSVARTPPYTFELEIPQLTETPK